MNSPLLFSRASAGAPTLPARPFSYPAPLIARPPAHEGVEVADVVADRLLVDEVVARPFAPRAPGLQRAGRAADVGRGRFRVVPGAAGVGVEHAAQRGLDEFDRDVRHWTHLQ